MFIYGAYDGPIVAPSAWAKTINTVVNTLQYSREFKDLISQD